MIYLRTYYVPGLAECQLLSQVKLGLRKKKVGQHVRRQTHVLAEDVTATGTHRKQWLTLAGGVSRQRTEKSVPSAGNTLYKNAGKGKWMTRSRTARSLCKWSLDFCQIICWTFMGEPLTRKWCCCIMGPILILPFMHTLSHEIFFHWRGGKLTLNLAKETRYNVVVSRLDLKGPHKWFYLRTDASAFTMATCSARPAAPRGMRDAWNRSALAEPSQPQTWEK